MPLDNTFKATPHVMSKKPFDAVKRFYYDFDCQSRFTQVGGFFAPIHVSQVWPLRKSSSDHFLAVTHLIAMASDLTSCNLTQVN
jgi:hypothetical protein